MRDINLNLNNNNVVARFIFDEVAVWQSLKEPKQSLESFIGDMKKLLDKVQEKGYNKSKLEYRLSL